MKSEDLDGPSQPRSKIRHNNLSAGRNKAAGFEGLRE